MGDRSSKKARREVAATMDDKKQAWPETPAVANDSAAGLSVSVHLFVSVPTSQCIYICLFISVYLRLDVSVSVSVSAFTFRV